MLGFELMPWQEQVIAVATEMLPNGRPAYRKVVYSTGRQNGKTLVTLVVALERMLMRGRRQSVVYTAQSGLEARQKFIEEAWTLLQESSVHPFVSQYYKAAADTGLVMHNGSRFRIVSLGRSSGHGKTLDLVFLDETFEDKDDRREQAFRPAMKTRPHAQMWVMSTAGDQESTYLLREFELGRAAVAAGRREGIAYFEWSAPEDADIHDDAAVVLANPALGYTLEWSVLEDDRSQMEENGFRRSDMNQWVDAEERVIPEAWWSRVSSPQVQAQGSGAVFAVDARADRSMACVTVGDSDGRVELVEARSDVSWLVDWFAESASRRSRPVFVDGSGPLAAVADRLERDGVNVCRVQVGELKKAAAFLYDCLADGRLLRVRSDGRLDGAVRSAVKRPLGDSFVWHRDVPGGDLLNAVSLVFWGGVNPEPVRVPTITFV